MSEEIPDEPKLIIDEDWKTQVEREKEELKKKLEEPTQDVSNPASIQESPTSEDATRAPDISSAQKQALPPPPPASLNLLVTTLATQAMAALGLMPDEEGQPLPANLDFARHFIDMIAVVEEKTQGNLTREEQTYVRDALHQLRMAFVSVSTQKSN
jgi:hypothetical protein